MAKNIGELLVRENLIDIEQLNTAKKEQKVSGGRLGAALVKLGYVNDQELTDFMSKQYNVAALDLTNFDIQEDAIGLLTKEVCEKHCVIPISKAGNVVVVAMADPSNIYVRDDLAFLTRSKVEVVVAAENQIRSAIEQNYSSKVNYGSIMTEMEQDSSSDGNASGTGAATQIVDLEKGQDDAPVVKFVNLMLSDAIKVGASDIHIEPYEKKLRVRFRIDGKLYEKVQPHPSIAGALVSRVKIMSKLDISEKRRPQDGRLKIALKNGREIDFRVSVLPTLYGEKCVLRLLDKGNLQLDMTKLGFEAHELEKFKSAIHLPHGMVLITGPTGSGKSTTIYSALSELNTPDINISTAEDPVEFNLEGINQVQMNADVNLNFANALRSFLRQDPDVIMVGEIRDFETAEVAFKAALTGHMVVSTLHTNDAPSTINRLLNMGVEPFLVTSAINLVVAQRLVRKICSSCKIQTNVDQQTLLDIGIRPEELGQIQIFKGEGCDACAQIGYKGRIAIYEIMEFNDALKQKVFQHASPMELKKTAMESGMQSLRQSALNKMKAGLTTVEEVLEVSTKESAE